MKIRDSARARSSPPSLTEQFANAAGDPWIRVEKARSASIVAAYLLRWNWAWAESSLRCKALSRRRSTHCARERTVASAESFVLAISRVGRVSRALARNSDQLRVSPRVVPQSLETSVKTGLSRDGASAGDGTQKSRGWAVRSAASQSGS